MSTELNKHGCDELLQEVNRIVKDKTVTKQGVIRDISLIKGESGVYLNISMGIALQASKDYFVTTTRVNYCPYCGVKL